MFLVFGWAARELQNSVEAVVLRHLVSLLKTARDTAMENSVFSALLLHAHGLHESLALRFPIAGVHVNVLAPQTVGTVIRVAVTPHNKTALFAGEILSGALKFLYHCHYLLPFVILVVKETVSIF